MGLFSRNDNLSATATEAKTTAIAIVNARRLTEAAASGGEAAVRQVAEQMTTAELQAAQQQLSR
ncbi:hypothetical protein [Streptomyces sp. UH6]|uniref:hypothetical protein n=1 Tax=Streptomyces sp. UH6 TaxID=2748379 RepID=UPI0015D4BABF|nr:hypothetical protein [Streptomyces sp. UH6]NYV73141.1 hypothetical protein [Streptomyces sp. UH6]